VQPVWQGDVPVAAGDGLRLPPLRLVYMHVAPLEARLVRRRLRRVPSRRRIKAAVAVAGRGPVLVFVGALLHPARQLHLRR
jgi:hypothetical protein